VRIVNKKKPPPGAIPLERLLLDKGFQRNYDIEFKTALDAELHGNAAANIRRKDTNRETAKQARIEQGLRTKAAIKAIMAKHPMDAKPGEIWPYIEAALEMKISKTHAYQVMRHIREKELKTKQSK
jgi:hypothetical protein